jgi:phosphoesterase RecJ-like protein
MTAPRRGEDATVREIADVLRPLPRLLVTAHVNPDGDAVGSALAALQAYRALGGEARYVQVGPIARTYRFLPGFDAIVAAPEGLDPPPDVLLSLDAASADRVEPVLSAMPAETEVLNVDHHVSNTRFGDRNLVDPEAAATAEVLHAVLRELGAPLTPEVATCLYAGIVTDTGRFGYPGTGPGTHRIAAELLEAGIRPEEVHGPLYRSVPIGLLRLTGALIAALETRLDGRLAWVELTRAACEEAGVAMKDAADLVDIPASVEGVEVAALFRETDRPGKTKVSLRSKGTLRVDRIAVRRGGGGHPAAAGFTADGSVGEVRDPVLREIEEAFADGGR